VIRHGEGGAWTLLVAIVVLAIACAASPPPDPAPGEPFDPTVARRMAVDNLHGRMQRGEKVIVVDARTYAKGPILPGAVHVPTGKLQAWTKDLPPDALIVTYCA